MTITQDIERQWWSVGEVADILGVAESCVRYWSQEFNVDRHRSLANHRRFVLQEITKLQVIKFLLHEEKYTVEGCKSKLKLLTWPIPVDKWEQEVRSQLGRIMIKAN